jgi:hypothetical protein
MSVMQNDILVIQTGVVGGWGIDRLVQNWVQITEYHAVDRM